ncbi:FG-GAP repeat protein [Enhygromyxa salina]|uniref:FG-GAP repeat protein n=1 Tax=Enhygromyxa salina TaxID=215803 RepID=A0A2S9YCS3_9BACT|nr:VCBS repeat-containing protein [Enhygromyxa salina]PRQ02801.1 FG-GAP repeat protein [Enhygromyxa salina]
MTQAQASTILARLGLSAGLLSSALLLAAGCGRLVELEDREPFGTAGSGPDGGDDEGNNDLGEDPNSGGSISESCYDGELTPGELCQVQPPDDLDAGIDPCALSIADFDDDGRPDLAVPNSNFLYPGAPDVANVLRGYGNGKFAPTQAYDAGAELPVGLAVGDFDGDGRVDIATANFEAEAAYILRNLGGSGGGSGGGGTMGFAAASGVGVESIASSIESGDFNGDGLDDLIVNTPSGVALLQGGASGVDWMYTLDVGTGQSEHAKLVDLDNDGRLDLASAVSDSLNGDRVVVFHGGGDGTFPERVEYPLGGTPGWIVAGDLNMDGDLDLAVSESSVNKVALLLGNSLGGFSPRTEIDVCEGPQSVAIGDMNNDGASDLVVGCLDADRIELWLQVEDGAFELVRWWGTGSRPVSLQLGDLNLDGQLDIAWANQLSDTVGVVISHI